MRAYISSKEHTGNWEDEIGVFFGRKLEHRQLIKSSIGLKLQGSMDLPNLNCERNIKQLWNYSSTTKPMTNRNLRRAGKVLATNVPLSMERTVHCHKKRLRNKFKWKHRKSQVHTIRRTVKFRTHVVHLSYYLLLHMHERLGLVQNQPDSYFDSLSHEDIDMKSH